MQQSFKSTATTTISTVLAAAGQRCSVTTCKLNHMRSQRQQCTKCQQEPAAHCHHTPQTEQSGPSQLISVQLSVAAVVVVVSLGSVYSAIALSPLALSCKQHPLIQG
eukprot:15510-Heterococcus_DN1.PRE.3